MNNIRNRLIHLYHCRGVSWRLIYKLLKQDSTLLSIFSFSPNDFLPYFQGNPTKAQMFFEDIRSLPLTSILTNYEEKGIHILTIADEEYPILLKRIYDPPWVLFYKGDLSILNSTKMISVVGTRYPSSNGEKSTKKIIHELAKSDFTIVSGLAIGIDTYAHHIAIKERVKTIAVLGSGHTHIYPSQNKKLAEIIAEQHLLLSEFLPHQRPQRWHFPLRNRIISGLSSGTLVIEAKSKSGSLITANQALEQGREVFAVPGSILESRSEGTNHLIQQGAKLVLNGQDIMEEIL